MNRKPCVAGQFYPADPRSLEKEIKTFLQNTTPLELNGRIHGLVVPHAGYIYSGQRAAEAYQILSGRTFRNVVVITPSHREFFDYLSVYPGDGYETPLGVIPRTDDFDTLIESSNGCRFSEKGHNFEHALEVQLPFLQVVLGNSFRLLPLVIGNQDEATIHNLSDLLKSCKKQDPDALIVASSDLSHFHTASVAKKMDGQWIEAMKAFDLEQLKHLFLSQTCEACGGGGILGLMTALKSGKSHITVTGYSHSGEINRDESSVVGYTSAIIWET
jgi:MEMO1 family protein